MTLPNSYTRIISKIEVTGDMRARILQNLRHPYRVRTRPDWRKLAGAAACLVVLLAGASLPVIRSTLDPGPAVQAPSGIAEAASLEELASWTGLPIAEPEHLPFAVEETVYLSYWGEMAEITYSGEGKSCSYRVSAGSGDNSGDYNAYPEESRLELGGTPVTAKGDGELYYLILWEKDGYSFSLRFPEGIAGEELEAVFS